MALPTRFPGNDLPPRGFFSNLRSIQDRILPESDLILFDHLNPAILQMRTRLLVGLTALLIPLVLSGCDWNRSAKAQRQEYRYRHAKGPAFTPAPNQLVRRTDYFAESQSAMLEQMR